MTYDCIVTLTGANEILPTPTPLQVHPVSIVKAVISVRKGVPSKLRTAEMK